ncbi:ATP-binding cassette domain-containing protein [Alkalibacillus aidingensis]|uniref:ATP-binding cassette domain-containing protein n=1 Tax=Alkalibacillus aidingensis TaxID=2747607 RepID=UPI0016615999|nr:ATP-binding cassette domain-containing protein [Alkalibacillus aidingensis]
MIVNLRKQLETFELAVDLEFGREITTIVGHSGAGKSTLLNCIAGMTSPDDGEIILDNQVFFHYKKRIQLPIRKRNVGYIFQENGLLPHLTVQENILFNHNHQLKDPHIDRLLNHLQVAQLLEQYPHQISGGEKQRVNLVRALAVKPDVLLLDEPFSSLDDENRLKGQNLLMELQMEWEIPFVMVTHSMEEAERTSERLIRINKGTVTFDSSNEE